MTFVNGITPTGVDNKLAAQKHISADITDAQSNGSSSTSYGKLAKWSNNGTLSSNDPVYDIDLVNKRTLQNSIAASSAGTSILPNINGVQAWGTHSDIKVEEETSDSRIGRYYTRTGARVVITPGGFTQVDSSLTYYISFWAKADIAGSKIFIECRDDTGQHAVSSCKLNGDSYTQYIASDMTLPTTWTKYVGTIAFKDGVDLIKIGAVYWNHENGSVRTAKQCISDIQIIPLPPHTHTSVDISDRTNGVWSGTAAGKLISTFDDGFLHVSKVPVSNNHVTNKQYVDTKRDISSAILSSAVNLDAVKSTGVYFQKLSTDATSANNYPVGLAGLLEVECPTNDFVYQRYTSYGSNATVYIRGCYLGTWGPWKTLPNMTDVDAKVSSRVAGSGVTKIEVVSALPSSPVSTTLYVVV